MVRVTNYKVRVDGKYYIKGESIDCLLKDDEERLIKLGYVESAGEIPEGDSFLADLTVDEGKQWVDTIEDAETLIKALDEEEQGKNRKTLLEIINNRLGELEENDN